MAKGLSLNIGANTKDAIKGIDQIGDGLEELQDDLGETVKDSEKLERKFSDDMRDMAAAAEKTGRSVGKEINDGTRKAGKGMTDLKDESRQSLRETAASIKDVSDGLDAVQEIAANALVGFGPAGFVAGAAAATGLGLVSEAIRTAQDDADELKRRLAAAYQSAAEEGRNFLDEAQVQAATLDIIFGENQGLYQQAQRDAANLGLSTQEVVRALAGDQDALNHVLQVTNDLEAARNQKLVDGVTPMERRALLNTSEGQTLGEINNRYETQKRLVDENAAKAEAYLDTTRKSHEEIQKANKALAETPRTVPVSLTVDDADLQRKLAQNRTIAVEVQFTRNGSPVY